MGRRKRRWRKKKEQEDKQVCRQYYGNMYPGHLAACSDWTEE